MRTVYHNGIVYTGTMPLAEAFVVEDGTFLYAGSNEGAKAFALRGESFSREGHDGEENGPAVGRPEARGASGVEFTDLEGKFVCASFNDSHMHLLEFGHGLHTPRLAEHTGSLEELLNCLKDFLKEYPRKEGGWLTGRGWNHDYFTDVHRMPDRYDLDRVSAEIPVCAVRACGHCLTVNSKALKLLGVTADTPQPEGGCIGIADGEPDGRFYENAMDMVYEAIPQPDKETVKEMIRSACKVLNSYGITHCQTDDYGAFRKVPWETVNEACRELAETGELTVRVYEQSIFFSLSELKEFTEAGYRTGIGDEMFKIGPLKLVADGALGAHTAYLSAPYADDPSTCGIPSLTQETLNEMIGYAHEQGMQVAVHAIGDACLDSVLSAFEKALAAHPRKDHRHGIVHCQITRPDQLEKIRKLQLHVYAQSIFLDYDIRMVEDRVGKERAASSYSWKTLLKGGVRVSNGSDCPVETAHVMSGIQCAVTRCTLNGEGPYLPGQAYTVREALDSYTLQGAYGSFEEERKGAIRAGMQADFVILGQNPFETAPQELKNIPVRATYLAGRKVFGREA